MDDGRKIAPAPGNTEQPKRGRGRPGQPLSLGRLASKHRQARRQKLGKKLVELELRHKQTLSLLSATEQLGKDEAWDLRKAGTCEFQQATAVPLQQLVWLLSMAPSEVLKSLNASLKLVHAQMERDFALLEPEIGRRLEDRPGDGVIEAARRAARLRHNYAHVELMGNWYAERYAKKHGIEIR